MANLISQQYGMNGLEAYASQKSKIHEMDSTLKIIAAMVYLIVLASFHKWEIVALMPMALLVYLWLTIANVPLKPLLKRLLIAEPLLIGIGILNPFFERTVFTMGSLSFSAGWLTFASLVMRGSLSVLMVFALIGTTGMTRLSEGMKRLGLPQVFILQILMTYRYIGVLMDEVSSMTHAYHLRAPKQKGIALKHMGSFAGQLLLRTLERSERIYAAMKVRGFQGTYKMGPKAAFKKMDGLLLGLWLLCVIGLRLVVS